MFNKLIDSINGTNLNDSFNKELYVYPVLDSNLEAIKILIHNCFERGKSDPSNVELVSINPNIWLSDFINKNIEFIKMVSTGPSFSILKSENDNLFYKNYHCESIKMKNDIELEEFFRKNEWKSLVIFTIVKIADLRTMKSWYNIRYADITEEYEQRDKKIKKILE